jgi:chorismate mutase/prephenate dehydratase
VLVRLFREIMSACLAQQEPLKIGFLGPEGTFSQQAVFKHFGHSAHGLPLNSIEEVFQEVESGNADFGVVPVENSGQGTIQSTLDMFLTSGLKICGEVELRVDGALHAGHQREGEFALRAKRHDHLPDHAGARAALQLRRERLGARERLGVDEHNQFAGPERDERQPVAHLGTPEGVDHPQHAVVATQTEAHHRSGEEPPGARLEGTRDRDDGLVAAAEVVTQVDS